MSNDRTRKEGLLKQDQSERDSVRFESDKPVRDKDVIKDDTTPIRDTLHTINFGIEPVLIEEEPIGFMRLQESISNNLVQAAEACDPYEPVETEVAVDTRKMPNTQTSIGPNNNQTFGPRESQGTLNFLRIQDINARVNSSDIDATPIELPAGSIINENDLHPETKSIKLVGEIQMKVLGRQQRSPMIGRQ